MQEAKILSLANLTGKTLLQSGAETYRVESCIQQICKHFGLLAQTFVSITCIITSAKNKEGNSLCSVERVTSISNNLHRIDQIHDILLHLEEYDTSRLEKTIYKIRNTQVHKTSTLVTAYFFAAFFFCLLFKGGFQDAIMSGIGGILIFYLSLFTKKLRVNPFFFNTLGGFSCTLTAYLWYKLHILNSVSYASIGTIMLLVPGLALTNAIRDLVAGDLLSGISRACEALLIGTALATGAGFALFLLFQLEMM